MSTAIQVLENFLLATSTASPDVRMLSRGPVAIRHTALPSPVTNLVGLPRPTPTLSDDQIGEVVEVCRSFDDVFGWLVGPNSPEDLLERLGANGFEHFETFAGLQLRGESAALGRRRTHRIEQVPEAQRPAFASTFELAFGLPAPLVEFMCEHYFWNPHFRPRNFLVYDKHDEPVAAGSSLVEPASGALLLGGAAVLPERRGSGIYQELTHHRIELARRDGVKSVLIQAVERTSAPICQKLGFEQVCRQSLLSRLCR